MSDDIFQAEMAIMRKSEAIVALWDFILAGIMYILRLWAYSQYTDRKNSRNADFLWVR